MVYLSLGLYMLIIIVILSEYSLSKHDYYLLILNIILAFSSWI
ncbi:hypothetical protein XSR1_30100 [Xenorhabdus szentirmaii DSM 16338]|uniref:Uncharacterized protein n=1 Tax=Xenorhabdus szentirmaii DSM 16338 TaxID=1427518 RepID=W1J036_9GAMM|nr:hypothetical protein XSR1_30100 [Xenorhabdus szentirmaii DSM 16338]